VSKFELPEIKF